MGAGSGGAVRCFGVLSSAVSTELPSVVVWNPLGHKRTDIVTVHLEEPVGDAVTVLDSSGGRCARWWRTTAIR